MIRIPRFIMQGFFYAPYLYHRMTGTGPFSQTLATDINPLFNVDVSPLISGLNRHYVKQFHEASCSVASVVMVINTLRELQGFRSSQITQSEILDTIRTGFWKERMNRSGHNGRRGVPLPLLGRIVKDSLVAYGVAFNSVKTVHGTKPSGFAKARTDLRNRLLEFVTANRCLIIAHFGQGAFLQVPNIPHISPVGDFDPRTGEVTLLDVDPDQEHPYKVSFDTFCRGIFSPYHPFLRPFGYQSGGYVCITLNRWH